jgi:hypothetical protein
MCGMHTQGPGRAANLACGKFDHRASADRSERRSAKLSTDKKGLSMDGLICWDTFVNRENRRLAEAMITADLKAGAMPFTRCHDGPVIIALSCVGPFHMLGRVKCSCGTEIGDFRGSCDGIGLSYLDRSSGAARQAYNTVTATRAALSMLHSHRHL